MLTYYQILGISEYATADEIKAAYKKLALKLHPDRHQGDPDMEERFKEINNAYQTLSNPYKRHRYDMTQKFGSFDIPQTPPPPPPRYRPRKRPVIFKRPSVTSRENLMGTLYAFLFAFVMGVLIKGGMWVHDYYKAAEREKLLSERREVFGEVQQAYNQGQWGQSLTMLDEMGMFFESEKDMSEYKDMLLTNILLRAEQSMEEKRYQHALNYYHMLDNFPNGNSLTTLLNKAEAYKQLEQYQNAIQVYQQLYYSGYRSVSYYVELGTLYEAGLKEYDKALQYYQQATKLAIEDYEASFGKAYPVIINAKLIPKNHYDLFIKQANALYLTENYEAAIKSTDWTKEIWPDSAASYLISGKSLEAQLKPKQACREFWKAKRRDSSVVLPANCR